MIMTAAESGPGLFFVWLALLFASAGVLEHSGIKIPFFAFFSHDSGKRPQEAPFNMLLAMGLSCALLMAIGTSPGWFYELLPFRDQALEYLALDLFSTSHIIQQLELLAFAVLAFMVLKWVKLYPPERPGVILDAEWLWRKAAPSALRALAWPAGAPGRVLGAAAAWAIARVLILTRQVFAADGVVARKVPLTASAVWTLAILGLVLAFSLLS